MAGGFDFDMRPMMVLVVVGALTLMAISGAVMAWSAAASVRTSARSGAVMGAVIGLPLAIGFPYDHIHAVNGVIEARAIFIGALGVPACMGLGVLHECVRR